MRLWLLQALANLGVKCIMNDLLIYFWIIVPTINFISSEK